MSVYYFSSLVLSNGLLLFAAVYSVYVFAHVRQTNNLQWFVAFLFGLLCIECLNKCFIYLLEWQDTSFTYPVYVFLEFFCLSQWIALNLGFSKRWRLAATLGGFLLFIEAVKKWSSGALFSPWFSKIILHLLVITGMATVLLKYIREENMLSPVLLLYGVVILYYTTSLFLFLLLDQLTEVSVRISYLIWGLNNTFSAILYGSSIYVFYRLKRLR